MSERPDLPSDVVFLGKQAEYPSSTSLSIHISTVNNNCYTSPPVQTMALFAKLLTAAFEEMSPCACVWRQHQFYSRLKAVKGLQMMVMFARRELSDVRAVAETPHCRSC